MGVLYGVVLQFWPTSSQTQPVRGSQQDGRNVTLPRHMHSTCSCIGAMRCKIVLSCFRTTCDTSWMFVPYPWLRSTSNTLCKISLRRFRPMINPRSTHTHRALSKQIKAIYHKINQVNKRSTHNQYNIGRRQAQTAAHGGWSTAGHQLVSPQAIAI